MDGTKDNTLPAWYHAKFFRYGAAILLALTIIFVFYQVAFFLKPILDFISILIVPILISFLFYYLLRPLVRFLEKMKIPKPVGIAILYVIIGCLIVFFFAYLGPLIAEQVAALTKMSVETLEKIKTSSRSLASQIYFNIDKEVEQRIFYWIQHVTSLVSKNFLELVATITHIATVLAVIPFIVFYLLKDDQEFSAYFIKRLPSDFRQETSKILSHIDTTLSDYITGLALVASSVGLFLLIGYLIIGLNYSLLLALIAVVLMTIPFLGPFLAFTPALLVGWAESSWMAGKVAIVFLIAQQLESNVISPQIIGQRLHMHPLLIILLLLAAGSLYGLLGLILVTPLFAVARLLVENLYKIYQLRR